MKKHHTTLVLLTLFFTGLIVLWWANYVEVPTSQELEANRNFVLPQLAKTSTGEIRKIVVNQPNEHGEAEAKEAKPVRLVFERRKSVWQMLEPIDAAADSSRLDLLAQSLKNLTKSPEAGTIHDSGARFGLDPASASIEVFSKDLQTPIASLEIGKAFRDLLYVRPNGTEDIEVVAARFFQGIHDQPLLWREKSLFNLATFQVGGLTIAGPGRDLKAERISGHWRLLRPFRTLGDDDKFEGVLGELTSLQVADGEAGFVADNVRDLARYGLDEEQGIHVELRPVLKQLTPQRILIGKAVPAHDDKFYAMQDGQDDVVMINGKGLHDLGVDPNTVRSNKVVDFNPAQARFVRIEALGRTFEMARTEQGWEIIQPSRGPADHQLITTLLSELQELQTSEFFNASQVSDPELDPPSVRLKLWQGQVGRATLQRSEHPSPRETRSWT